MTVGRYVNGTGDDSGLLDVFKPLKNVLDLGHLGAVYRQPGSGVNTTIMSE
jgi:hypothetical protein